MPGTDQTGVPGWPWIDPRRQGKSTIVPVLDENTREFAHSDFQFTYVSLWHNSTFFIPSQHFHLSTLQIHIDPVDQFIRVRDNSCNLWTNIPMILSSVFHLLCRPKRGSFLEIAFQASTIGYLVPRSR